MKNINNISLKEYRIFLISNGLKATRTKGGHEHYTRSDIDRPITLQSHKDPVPAFIIKQHLRYLSMSTKDFLNSL